MSGVIHLLHHIKKQKMNNNQPSEIAKQIANTNSFNLPTIEWDKMENPLNSDNYPQEEDGVKDNECFNRVFDDLRKRPKAG